jgi:hypothetical protein
MPPSARRWGFHTSIDALATTGLRAGVVTRDGTLLTGPLETPS